MNDTYIGRVEVDRRADAVSPGDVDQLMDELAEYAAAVGRSPRGWLEITLTVPGVNLRQATTTALAVVEIAVGPLALSANLLSCEITTEKEADARDGFASLPSLIGTAEAAHILELSQQRVVQLVNAGQLSATKAGRSLALARHEVEAFASRERKPGRPASKDASGDGPARRSASGSKFEVYPSGGEWRFRLKAANGQIVASSEAYSTKAAAMQGAEAVRRAAETASTVEG